jgi:hypothetical protein
MRSYEGLRTARGLLSYAILAVATCATPTLSAAQSADEFSCKAEFSTQTSSGAWQLVQGQKFDIKIYHDNKHIAKEDSDLCEDKCDVSDDGNKITISTKLGNGLISRVVTYDRGDGELVILNDTATTPPIHTRVVGQCSP